MRKYIIFLIIPIFGYIFFFKFYKNSTELCLEIETCIDIPCSNDSHYYCTAANSNYYNHLLNMIASIHRHDFDLLGQIAVFDLGLTASQINSLSQIEKVTIHKVEKVNLYILDEFKVNKLGKTVPGWYSWKPVIIKQAFDLFPSGAAFIWIDAGTTILQDISPLFEYIKEHGYFFHNGWDHSIKRHVTQYVLRMLDLKSPELSWLLKEDTYFIEAGIMGFSVAVYASIILPMYNFAKDIYLFADDGSAREGFGNARHDQTLFSILIRSNELLVFDHFKDPYAPFVLECENKKISFHIASRNLFVNNKTNIVCSRDNLAAFSKNKNFLRYKGRAIENEVTGEQNEENYNNSVSCCSIEDICIEN